MRRYGVSSLTHGGHGGAVAFPMGTAGTYGPQGKRGHKRDLPALAQHPMQHGHTGEGARARKEGLSHRDGPQHPMNPGHSPMGEHGQRKAEIRGQRHFPMLGGHAPTGAKGAKTMHTTGPGFPMGIPGTHAPDGRERGGRPSDSRLFDASLKDGSDKYRKPDPSPSTHLPQGQMAHGHEGGKKNVVHLDEHAKRIVNAAKRKGKGGRVARHLAHYMQGIKAKPHQLTQYPPHGGHDSGASYY